MFPNEPMPDTSVGEGENLFGGMRLEPTGRVPHPQLALTPLILRRGTSKSPKRRRGRRHLQGSPKVHLPSPSPAAAAPEVRAQGAPGPAPPPPTFPQSRAAAGPRGQAVQSSGRGHCLPPATKAPPAAQGRGSPRGVGPPLRTRRSRGRLALALIPAPAEYRPSHPLPASA